MGDEATLFWAGALVGAFLGVLFSFLARPIERALDRHGERIASERGAEIVEAQTRDKQAVRDYLVVQLIEIAVVGAVTGVGSGIFFTANAVVSYLTDDFQHSRWILLALNVVGQGIAILGAAVVLRIATTSVRTARLIRKGKIRKQPRAAA